MEFKLIPTTSAQADNPDWGVGTAIYRGWELQLGNSNITKLNAPFTAEFSDELPAGWEWDSQTLSWNSCPVFKGSDNDTFSPTKKWIWTSSDSSLTLVSQGNGSSAWGNDYYSVSLYNPTIGNTVPYNTDFIVGGKDYATGSVGCTIPLTDYPTSNSSKCFYSMMSVSDNTYDDSSDDYTRNVIASFVPEDYAWNCRIISPTSGSAIINTESTLHASTIYNNPSSYSNREWHSMSANTVLAFRKISQYQTPSFIALGHTYGTTSQDYEGWQNVKTNHTSFNYILGDKAVFNDSAGRISIEEPTETGVIHKGEILDTNKRFVFIYNPLEAGDGYFITLSSRAFISFWDGVLNSIVGIETSGTVGRASRYPAGALVTKDDVIWSTIVNQYKQKNKSFYIDDKEFYETSPLGQQVKYTISSIYGPGFSKRDIVGGVNYSMDINSSDELKIGDVTSGMLSWTSRLDVTRFYKNGDLKSYGNVTVDDSTKWNFYVKDDKDTEWKKLGAFTIKSEDLAKDNLYLYKAYDALFEANRSADKFLAAKVSEDGNYHWDNYKIDSSNETVTFNFDSSTTLTIPTTKDSNTLTILDGDLRFKGVRQVNLHPYKVRVVRAKYMGNFNTGAIDSIDTPRDYMFYRGEEVLINDNDRFLAGFRAKINPTKLKEKLDELGIGYDEFNIRDYSNFSKEIIKCMDVTDEKSAYWISKTNNMSGTPASTYGDFIIPVYKRVTWNLETKEKEYVWTKFDNVLDMYIHAYVPTYNYVPSSDTWVNFNGEPSYIDVDNRYPSKYTGWTHDSTSDRTYVTVERTWALWGVSLEDIWCTDLAAVERDPGVISYEVIEDMYDYETAVRPIDSFSFFGYESKIYKISSFRWLNNGAISGDTTVGAFYSDDYEIKAKEVNITNKSETTGKTNNIGEEKLESHGSYWNYYVLTQVPKCNILNDFYIMILKMLNIPYVELTQSIKNLPFNNLLPSSGITYRNLLEFISEACGGFMYCNTDGNVTVGNYTSTDIFLNSSDYATKETANYTVPVLDNLRVFINEYNSKYFEFGLGANDYFITGNPLMYTINDDDTTLKGYLEELYDEINLVEYVPMKIKTYSNPYNIKVGDIIWVDGKQTIVMSMDISSSGYAFQSTGPKERKRPVAKNTNDYVSVSGNYTSINESHTDVGLAAGDDTNKYKLFVTKDGAFTQKDDETPLPISNPYTAGTGISIANNTISTNLIAGSGISIVGNTISLNLAVYNGEIS